MAVGGHRAARGVGAEEDVGAKSECQDDQEGQFGSELDAGLTGCLTDTLEDVGWRWAMETWMRDVAPSATTTSSG